METAQVIAPDIDIASSDFVSKATVPETAEPKMAGHTRVSIVGMPVSALLFDRQMETILSWAQEKLSKIVFVANVHMLVEANQNADFGKVLHHADMVTPDGMPLVWLIRALTGKPQDRVAGMDILLALCEKAAASQLGVYFLGSEQITLDLMKERLAEDFPTLPIAGMKTLPFCDEFTPEQNSEVVQAINESGAGLVFVALGCPKQEKWMSQHRDQVHAVMIGIGGAFPVYAGLKKWAPLWVRQSGLEWLYRFSQEPKRLWKRYLKTNSRFVWLMIKQRFSAK